MMTFEFVALRVSEGLNGIGLVAGASKLRVWKKWLPSKLISVRPHLTN
jgi:hypothetical protein